MHCKVILMMKHCSKNLKENFKNVGVMRNLSPLHELKQEQMEWILHKLNQWKDQKQCNNVKQQLKNKQLQSCY